MRNKRPLVIVTGPRKWLRTAWWFARWGLVNQGLRCRYVHAGSVDLSGDIRGVLICGGNDVEPEHYGIIGDAGTDYDSERDQLEMDVCLRAIDSGVPMMGICRGAQLINIVGGGSLYPDIRPLRRLTPNRNSVFAIKEAYLEEDSNLVKVVGNEPLAINSLHSQAMDEVAHQFRVVARDADGFVQAIEHMGDQWIFGMQWHPEYLPYMERQRAIFGAFADAVRRSDRLL